MSPTQPLHRGVPVNYLQPVQLSFEWMLCALRFAAHNVFHCRWNKGMTQSYLKSCAIPDRVTNQMYDYFNNMDVFEDIDGGTVQSNGYILYVWLSVISMSAWIDAGMHYIFHGIVARAMLAMDNVFAKKDRRGPFEDLINPYLLDIQELILDWLHMKPLPKPSGLLKMNWDSLAFSHSCMVSSSLISN